VDSKRTAQKASLPDGKPDIEIVVPVGPKDTSASGNSGLPMPHGQESDGESVRHFSWGDTPKGLRALVSGREIKRITVVRYIAGWDAQTPDVVRRKLFELTRRELEPPTGQIIWSETNAWTIEATVEFSKGPMMRILTDGSHTCLIDEAGKPWFFRISPAEFVCGYETPEKALHHDTTNWCRFRDFGVMGQPPRLH